MKRHEFAMKIYLMDKVTLLSLHLFTIAIRFHQQYYSSVRCIKCGFVCRIKTYQSTSEKEII